MRDVIVYDPELEHGLRAAGVRSAETLLALGDNDEPRRFVGFVTLDTSASERRFHLKRYRYAGWRQSRGLLGRGTLWGMPPELREFEALQTLRAGGIPAVRPAAACALWSGRRLVAHALLTVAEPDMIDLQTRLASAVDPLTVSRSARRKLAEDLGATLRRMHALPFVHRDLRARNVLVRMEGEIPTLCLLDCRRGGARGRGGAVDDLASLDRDLIGILTRGERRSALRAWLGGRADAKDVVREIALRRARVTPPRP